MKRIVRSEITLASVVAIATVAVVAATGAGMGAMYSIAFGFLAIALALRLGPERLQLWRERRDQAARGRY
jgi:hypothetical protein